METSTQKDLAALAAQAGSAHEEDSHQSFKQKFLGEYCTLRVLRVPLSWAKSRVERCFVVLPHWRSKPPTGWLLPHWGAGTHINASICIKRTSGSPEAELC